MKRTKYAVLRNTITSKTVQKRLLLLPLLLIISSFSAFACSCLPLKDLTFQEYYAADLIFEGTATKIEIDKVNYDKIITFKITNPIKTEKGQETVTIITAVESATCGLSISEGEKWYIWGHKSKETNGFRASSCSRSLKLHKEQEAVKPSPRYLKEMALINDLKSKKGKQTLTSYKGSATGKFCRGRQHGKWKFYNPKGTLVEECTFKKGKMVKCSKDEALKDA